MYDSASLLIQKHRSLSKDKKKYIYSAYNYDPVKKICEIFYF